MITLSKLLKESVANVMIGGLSYRYESKVNESPTKQGISLLFTPINNNKSLSKSEITSQIMLLLNKGLQKIGLQAEQDSDVLYDNSIGFLIRISYLDNIIKNIIGNEGSGTENQP